MGKIRRKILCARGRGGGGGCGRYRGGGRAGESSYFFVVKITITLFESIFLPEKACQGMPISSDTLGVPQTASRTPMLISQPWGGPIKKWGSNFYFLNFFTAINSPQFTL